eukprot:8925409-Pyramimonas_sp.AAC.1
MLRTMADVAIHGAPAAPACAQYNSSHHDPVRCQGCQHTSAMQAPSFALTLASTLTFSPKCPSDSMSYLANWLLREPSPSALMLNDVGMSESSKADDSSSDDASASVLETKSNSEGCPAEPARVVACVGAAVADGP